MGVHLNYYRVIYTLILLKERLLKIEKDKYKALVKELTDYEIDPFNEDQELPTNKSLAKRLNYSQAKTNNLLKLLHHEIIESSWWFPIENREYVHTLYIHIPEEMSHSKKNKSDAIEDEYTWVYIKLPHTPRLGEEIRLDFLEGWRYTYGYVHRIKHELDGAVQRILIFIHPFENYYYQWNRLKEEKDARERWRRSL